MFASLAGCNESERRGGPENGKIWRSSPHPEGEDSTSRRSLAEAAARSSGVVAAAR